MGIGDGPGYSNASLVNMLVRRDGVLLSPGYSATPIDAMFSSTPPPGEVWQAHTTVNGSTWYFVLAVDITPAYSVEFGKLWPRPTGHFVLFPTYTLWTAACANGSTTCTAPLASGDTWAIETGGAVGDIHAHMLYTIAPVLASG